MNFDMLLERYKANPRRESAALLLNDAALLKYCVIFRQVPVKRLDLEPEEASWPALWACVEVNVEAIATLADDPVVFARKKVEQIKGLRLVYPDGAVQQLVESVVAKRLKDALS